MNAVFEMWWDCEYCGTTALLGKTNRYCPQCGAPQNAERRYFPPPGKETAANDAYEGVDKSCPACRTPNGAKAVHCRHCGSPLAHGADVRRLDENGSKGQVAPALSAAQVATPRRYLWLYLLGGVGVLGGGLGLASLLLTRDSTATVTAKRWERVIDIEAIRPVVESAWCDGVPGDAYSVRSHREQRSTRQVPDGESCTTHNIDRGDGTFERREECSPRYRDEPVYDERCDYTVNRYRRVRGEEASGDSTAPTWPAVALGAGEREGKKRETYEVSVELPGKRQDRCSLTQERWESLVEGERYPVRVRVVGNGVDCSSLARAPAPGR